MNQSKSILIILLSVIMGLFGCKKSENTPKPYDPPINESELITTVKLIFTDTINKAIRIAKFSDIDGPGGKPPTSLDTIDLVQNRVYTATIYLLDESKNPVDSISNEVLTEGADHLFVFTIAGVNVNINISDKDKNNLPIGLISNWSTGSASIGNLTVTLKHQPGVKDGSAAPGETDVEVVFPCIVRK